MNPIVEEYLEKYVAEDGGGRLNPSPGDSSKPWPGCTLTTTFNENPILYLVQAALEFCTAIPGYMPRFKALYLKHMESTEVEQGLHSRRCGDTIYIGQSHDNIVAMVIGSYFFKTDHAELVFQHGSKNRWCFNVKIPREYDVKHQLQGGDVALCYLASGRFPPAWDLLWLAIGISISKTWNLADLRIQFLKMVMPTLAPWERGLLTAAILIHEKRRGHKEKYYGTRFGYYAKSHPYSRFQNEFKYP